MMKIIYTNNSGNELTERQVKESRDYNKIYIESSQVKQKEIYRNDRLFAIGYYIDETENETEVVDIVRPSEPNWISIIRREQINSYIIENISTYKNKILHEKYKRLFIHNEDYLLYDLSNCITSQKIDIDLNIPILGSTVKKFYFHDLEDDGFTPYFIVRYKDDGSFFSLEYFEPFDITDPKSGRIEYTEEEARQHFDGLLSENPDYYFNATFDLF